MGTRTDKKVFVKKLEADFARKFRVVLSPMKAAIRKEIDKGKTAHQAVDHVFREHDIRGHLKELVLDGAVRGLRGEA